MFTPSPTPTPPEPPEQPAPPASWHRGLAPSLPPPDRALLAALLTPGAPGPETPPGFDLHAFLARPDVQAAIDAHEKLEALRFRARVRASADLALETLSAILANHAEPVEARRAAGCILRLAARHLGIPDAAPSPLLANADDRADRRPPVHRVHGLRGFGPDAGPVPGSKSVAHDHSAESAFRDDPAPAAHEARDDLPCDPRDPTPVHTSPWPLPPRREPPVNRSSPETCVADTLANLRALRDNHTPQDAFVAVYNACDIAIAMGYGLQEPFIAQLLASPAYAARARPFRAEPVAVGPPDAFPIFTRPDDGHGTPLLTATQRVVFFLEDGRDSPCTFRLVTRRRADPSDVRWCLVAIDTG